MDNEDCQPVLAIKDDAALFIPRFPLCLSKEFKTVKPQSNWSFMELLDSSSINVRDIANGLL
jgi:hypothetical protein